MFSAKDMQQRLGLKRKEPVRYMMQKICQAIGKVSVVLSAEIESDNGDFTAHKDSEDVYELFNSGRGNVPMQSVLVMVESRERVKRKSADSLRMIHLPSQAGVTYSKLAKRMLDPKANVRSDANIA
jgi:hypothetical protein